MEIVMLGVMEQNFTQNGVIYSIDGVAPTLTARDYKGPKLIAIKN